MSRFLEALHSGRALLMDGALGTELQRAGLGGGACGERWNLDHPDRVRAIHQAYRDAGADCLLTNTFQSNPTALARHGLRERLEAINEAGLKLARSVEGQPFVLGDIGPLSAPGVLPDPNELRLLVGTLLTADAILLETWSDPVPLMAVTSICGPLREMSGLPMLLSITYRRTESGIHSFSGHPPEWFALQARQVGVDALGVNCGRDLGLDEVVEIVRRYRQITDLPLFARPNAGTPVQTSDGWTYPLTPEALAARVPELLAAGVRMMGGCCGTTPAHIAACRPVVDDWNGNR
ncbi:MAG: homocysteine S-methyltransferase family protein [Planctomycetia bacterium]|nr:homocysteine S-methyltransferase family protein [Planctomycetia bacterium]